METSDSCWGRSLAPNRGDIGTFWRCGGQSRRFVSDTCSWGRLQGKCAFHLDNITGWRKLSGEPLAADEYMLGCHILVGEQKTWGIGSEENLNTFQGIFRGPPGYRPPLVSLCVVSSPSGSPD